MCGGGFNSSPAPGVWDSHRFEARGEMPQQLRSIGKSVSLHLPCALPYSSGAVRDVIHVGLGVRPPRYCQTKKFEARVDHLARFWIGKCEHYGADLYCTYPALAVKFYRKRLPGEFALWNIGERLGRINIDGVSASRLNRGDFGLIQP